MNWFVRDNMCFTFYFYFEILLRLIPHVMSSFLEFVFLVSLRIVVPFVQCELHFELNYMAFSSDHCKISCLTGWARSWATTDWSQCSAVWYSSPAFLKTFTQIFKLTTDGREAALALVSLKQGKCWVIDYAVEFHTIVADSGWNQLALVDAFQNGFSQTLKDHWAPSYLPVQLEALNWPQK